jgi:hypothetical protein
VEAKRFLEPAFSDPSSKFLFFGFGMGYHVEVFLEKAAEGIQLLCVEPFLEIFELEEIKKK